ncbi:hypothetical protein CLU79DRAFT_768116 [Phycomyces nitens]|nr:hypothetical protein CLU79DRAFT_768116 [Phycomyces nitens]
METTNVRLLDKEVISQLRSSLLITSLKQCVIELIYNALDANATSIEVRVDTENLTVQVTDNGIGIHPESMTEVAKRYTTSKCHTIHDLQHLQTFGFRGEALAALAEASILQITSKHKNHKGFMTIWKDGVLVEHSLAKHNHYQQGTKVVVRNLFHKYPVRQKHQLSESQSLTGSRLEQIKREVSRISLVFPAVSFSVFNIAKDTQVMKTKKCSSSIGIFRQLFGYPLAQTLESFEVHKDDCRIHGYISTRGLPYKGHQNIYINRHWVPYNDLYKMVQDMLLRYKWDYKSVNSDCLYTNKRARTGLKYPIFLIQLDCPSLANDITLYTNILNEQESHGQIYRLLRDSVYSFLRSHDTIETHPKPNPKKMDRPEKPSSVYQKHTPSFNSTIIASPKPALKLSPELDPQELIWKDPSTGIQYYIHKRTGKSTPVLSRLHETESKNSINRSYLRTQPLHLLTKSAKDRRLTSDWPTLTNQIHTISKDDLKRGTVIAQVDRKYILLRVNRPGISLLFVDQHAADERIRLEQMMEKLKGHIDTQAIDPPIEVNIDSSLSDLVPFYRRFLVRWGIYLKEPFYGHDLLSNPLRHYTPELSSHMYTDPSKSPFLVYRLPALIADRCKKNPQHIVDLVNHYLAWLKDYKGGNIDDKRTCPQDMMEILKSISCRSAIMFNDYLSLENCQSIIQHLSDCEFPFHCAHGRPTIVPTLSNYYPPKKNRRLIHWDSLKPK